MGKWPQTTLRVLAGKGWEDVDEKEEPGGSLLPCPFGMGAVGVSKQCTKKRYPWAWFPVRQAADETVLFLPGPYVAIAR